MNKKIGLIAIVLFALWSGQFAFAGDSAYLVEVSSSTFLPTTIHSGDVVSLVVNIKNKGSLYSIIDLNANLDVGNQFETVALTDLIDEIQAGATKSLVFRFKAKQNTLPGYYSVFLSMNYLRDDSPVTQTQSILVPVSKSEKNIDVTVEPRTINPGNQSTITFKLDNITGLAVSNISFSWAESNDLILPVGSDNKRYVDILEAGKQAEISYVVAADPNITTGIYPLDITLSFTDYNGTKTQSSQVGLIVGGKTDFEISGEITSGQLSINIANIGSNNASAVIVKIPSQPGINVTGSNMSILGNLNKGDYTIASFTAQSTNSDLNFLRNSTTGFGRNQIAGATNATTETQNALLNQAADFNRQRIPAGMTPEQIQQLQSARQGTNANLVSVQIDYTDTTGERQSVTKTIQLSSSANAFSSMTNGRIRNQSSDLSIYLLAILVILVGVGIAINKFIAKQNWKKLAIILVAICVLFAIVYFAFSTELLALIVAAIISIAMLFFFFKKSLHLKKAKK